jgi:hypothetical protein
MSLQRRTIGRGRLIAAVSAVVVVVGCLLPWFRARPFAAGERPVAIDRWWAYAALALVAAVGIVLRVVAIGGEIGTFEAFLPDRAPGLWLAAAGTVGVAVGATEIRGERPA